MIAFGIAILIICLANLGFSAVLLFHLGRLVTIVEPGSKVGDLTQPPRLVQIKRPHDTVITEDVGKNARKPVSDDIVATNAMSDIEVETAISALEKN